MKKIFSLLILIAIVINIFGLNIYGDTKNNVEEIHIATIEDWNLLAKDCTLDIYSNDKKVILDKDISFAGETFMPLPYFNGEFDGGNHTLSGISIEAKTINNGVIRITCQNALIHDLTVKLGINSQANRTGFVGYNQGTLKNIKVDGINDGNSVIGLIAGYNSVSGKILNCISYGKLSGKHYVGGIVGTNYGRVEGCVNNAEVNTSIDSEGLDIETITLETIINSENVAAITDTGGIAGNSFGVISNSTNYSSVGHEHVGYNVGGIAGSQSGYLETSYNYGEIKGRKEVGGIAGQVEPNLMIKYSEDYLQKMKRQINSLKDNLDSVTDDISEIGDDTLSYSYVLSSNLNEAYRSIEIMLKEKPTLVDDGTGDYDFVTTSEYEDAKIALSASMSKFFDTWNSLISTNKSNVEDLTDDLNVINDDIEKLGNTAVDTVNFYTTERDLYIDVSDLDGDLNTDGKLKNCHNFNCVEGDLNVGGIVGAIAKENNLDPEDDFDITGKTSSNFTYQMRAVVDGCVNDGRIKAKKRYAGGIVGNQTLGLIKNSINYGLIDCEDSDYVGGVVGYSLANIKNCFAKCFIWGDEYVGGIAGSVSKAKDCGSLAQIVKANTNIGSLFGNYTKIESELVQETNEISNNWYVYDDYAGIDGISYDSKAYQINDEEMLNLQIDENLKKVNVIFLHDNNVVKKYTLDYGEDLDESKVPVNINDVNQYGYWEGFSFEKLQDITKDLLFINELNDVKPSISSDEELALVVAQGHFSYNDSISAIEIDELPNGEIEGHTIVFSTNLEKSSNIEKIRVYCFAYENYDVYLKSNGEFKKISPEIDGSYVVIDYALDIEAISIVKKANYDLLIKTSIGGVLILGIIAIVVKKRKNK